MKCYTCKTKMGCVDDINTEFLRIDLFECPKCKSKAEVKYSHDGEYIKKSNMGKRLMIIMCNRKES